MAVIQQVASDSILIIVSHKLKTLATADEIIVLESGQLTERGPLAELVNDDGVFNRLWDSADSSDRGDGVGDVFAHHCASA
ncbi:hypothetical protein K3W01_14745, partial [Listeria monocytogenes]|nr:hypothetical protein [Listeria monocytogenes]